MLVIARNVHPAIPDAAATAQEKGGTAPKLKCANKRSRPFDLPFAGSIILSDRLTAMHAKKTTANNCMYPIHVSQRIVSELNGHTV